MCTPRGWGRGSSGRVRKLVSFHRTVIKYVLNRLIDETIVSVEAIARKPVAMYTRLYRDEERRTQRVL